MIIENYPSYDLTEEGIITRVVGGQGAKIGKVLKHSLNNKGYYCVILSNENGQKLCRIHRLIALHFIPNPNNHPFVDHINGIRTDNRIENLRWVTKAQNQMNMKGKGYSEISNGNFQARIRVNKKPINLGTYVTKEEASAVYKEACIFYKGDFARK